MDDYEVKLTGQAQRQLQEIVRYIAEDLQEPATAARMLASMEKNHVAFHAAKPCCVDNRRAMA